MDIKRLRKEMGLTQQELAVKLGIGVTTVSRWERGTTRPSRMALKLLEIAKRKAWDEIIKRERGR